MHGIHPEKNQRILVIDDNRSIHQDFKKILSGGPMGGAELDSAESALFGDITADIRPAFQIDSAFQGEEGLAMVRESVSKGSRYALAFIDVRMPPGWDGIETAARIWKADPEVQVVICTAYSDYSWDEMVKRLECADRLLILKKPFDALEVLQLANTLTEKWRLHQLVKAQLNRLEGNLQARTKDLEFTNASLQAEIAERQRAAEALRESEERYQLLFRKNPLPMWAVDRETLAFLAVNETAVEEYGHSTEEFLALRLNDLKADPGALPAGDSRSEITRFRKKSGAIIDVEIICRDISFSGRPARLILAQDITDKKRLEAQFLRSQRMEGIGTLATGMAHDLNNILAPILISAGAMRWDLGEADRKRAIDQIEASVKRGADIIQQVLTFGRGVSGERVAVNPAELVGDVVKIVNQTFPKNLTLTSDIEPELWTLIGDKTQIHQVLLNLSINARDAMPDGGILSLAGRNAMVDEAFAALHKPLRPGPYVELAVKDTGCGIPAADLERIFDPFFTTKEVGKGTGLGLSTVLGIVKSHHGVVLVESAPKQGSTFKVLLPASPEVVATDVLGVNPLPQGNGERILIVDDEANIVQATKRMLEQYGYRVLTATGGREALKLFITQESPADLVITDIMMPGMDGIALVRALKKVNPAIQVLPSSGLGQDLAGNLRAAELEELGCRSFLAKPYTAEKILTTLHAMLRKSSPAPRLKHDLTTA